MNGASLLGPWLEQLAELSPLVAILAKVTMLLAVAWGARALIYRANPRLRVLVWRGVAVGLLLIPLCHLVTPPIEFQVPIPTIAAAGDEAVEVADEPVERAFADPETPALVSVPTGDDFLTHEAVVSDVEASGAPWWWSALLAV